MTIHEQDIMARIAEHGVRNERDIAAGWTMHEAQTMRELETGADPDELHRAAQRVTELLLASGHDVETAIGAAFILGWKAGRT